MSTMQRWSGREARLLRDAMRLSVRKFAAYLGVSDRTVSKWEAGGEQLVPLPESQALLDTALTRADPEVQERFRTSLVDPPSLNASETPGVILVPTLEPGLVRRSDDAKALSALLSEALDADGVNVVAVCGPGGFGKTTLATQICHDARVRELFPTILWVETGEDCAPARVVDLISDVCVHLDGARPALADPEQAGFHLARVLEGRRALLVIDNVWSGVDLRPFLMGGPECVRLVTTRNVRVCPSTARLMRLGPMSGPEVGELLRRSIPALVRDDAARLAELCGGWPLLATVVGSNVHQDVSAGLPPARAASDAGEALRTYGPQAFDAWDADQRSNAIGHAIMSSLDSLDEHVTISGGSALRERYLSLAIFPAATPIPVRVLTRWWNAAHGWTPSAVRQFCRVLADRSLVVYLADRDAILLHDVFREYLRRLIGDEWVGSHRSLVEAFRPASQQGWSDLAEEDGYLWRNLTHHLHEADLDDELVNVLASPPYVVSKVMRLGHQSLAADNATLEAATAPAAPEHALRHVWLAARTLTASGYLLHDLKARADIAMTLTVALLRAGSWSSPVAHLRQILAETGDHLHVLWAQAAADSKTSGGHVGAVVSVATREDLVVSGGEDGAVRLWDLQSRRLEYVLRGHTGWVFAVAISADGTLVASAGEDGMIRLWHASTGTSAGVLLGHARRVRSLAFVEGGALLVSGAEDGLVFLWDVERLALVRAMETPVCPVWSVAVGYGDTVVAVGGEDEFVRLYDLGSGRLLDERAEHRDWVRSLAFSPRAPLLASGSGDKSVLIWAVADQRLVPTRRITTSNARIRSVAISEGADMVVAAAEDATIRAITTDESAGAVTMPPGVEWVRSVALAEDGSVVAGCEDGGVRLWTASGPDSLTVMGAGTDTVWSACFADDGHLALLGHSDGLIEIRDAASADLRGRYSAGPGRVWSLAAGGDYFAGACGDGGMRVWSWRDDTWVLPLYDGPARTWAVAVARGVPLVASSAGDGRIRAWDLACGALLWERDAAAGRVRSLAFDDAGALLAAAGGDGSVHLWNAASGDSVARWSTPAGWSRTVALDPTGGRLAVGSGVGDIEVRDLATGEVTAQLSGHSGRVLALGFTRDTDQLVSAAADGTLRVWSLNQQRQIVKVRVDASLQCGAFDPTTGRLLAAGAAGVTALMIGGSAGGGVSGHAHDVTGPDRSATRLR